MYKLVIVAILFLSGCTYTERYGEALKSSNEAYMVHGNEDGALRVLELELDKSMDW